MGTQHALEQATKRALVAEDDESARRFLIRLLSMEGYEVVSATNGREARELLETGNFDVVLSDISMPEAGGIQLLQAVKKKDQDLPVILVTGDPSVDTAAQAVEYGALRYLLKPIKPAALREVLASAMRNRSKARRSQEAINAFEDTERAQNERARLERDFELALTKIWMAYQPIVCRASKRVYGYEALVRSDAESLSTATLLLDTAEELGKTAELGKAIRQCIADTFPTLDDSYIVFVNIHPDELTSSNLFDQNSPLSSFSHRVVLEITEQSKLDQVENLEDRIQTLRNMGYRLAIDDLGAGYAGLNSFIHFHPDLVKIDMSITHGVDADRTKQRVVQSITELCHDLKISVVAEGIENRPDRDWLAQSGINFFQGYFFGKPEREITPGEHLDDWTTDEQPVKRVH